jgi:tetratricopeptide (TPR) repeat protein
MISGLLFSCNTSDTPAVTKTPLKEVTLDSLKKLADQYPDSFPLKEDLLWTLRDSNEFSKAIDLAKKYLDKDTVNPKLWHIYADLLAENLDTLPAITAFEKSLSFGKNPDDLIALGQFYASTKNSLALKMALQLLEYKDDQLKATAHVIIGNYSAAINKKDDAIKEFDKSISITFSFMEAYLCKAQVLMDMNKYEEAIKVLENATKIKNSFDEGYYYLGQCYEKIKNKDMAIESYRRALLYSPDYQEAADALQRLSK